MTYTIKKSNAKNLISTIIDCVKKGKDKTGSEIQSWGVTTTDEGKEVLVHTPQQWDEKGCVGLLANEDNNEIKVKFYYWSTFPKQDRNEYDYRYIYGRFTELILAHFWSTTMQIIIAE